MVRIATNVTHVKVADAHVDPDLLFFSLFDSGNVGDTFDSTSGENGVPSFAQLQIVLFGEFRALTVKRYVDQLWDAYQLCLNAPSVCATAPLWTWCAKTCVCVIALFWTEW